MSKIIIYTDGSSRGNPGPGGFGAIIISSQQPVASIKEIGGREEKTTNNRMEMKAAIESLKIVPAGAEVEIHTDSEYLLNGITKWVYGWQANGWQTKDKKDVLNRDLWEELMGGVSKREVEWKKVVGHSGHSLNDRCDEIATGFADGKKVDLYNGDQKNYKIKESEGNQTPKGKAGKAYSYVSKVDNLIQTHQTWAECEKRVKGAKGARFRKALSAEEEKEIISLFNES